MHFSTTTTTTLLLAASLVPSSLAQFWSASAASGVSSPAASASGSIYAPTGSNTTIAAFSLSATSSSAVVYSSAPASPYIPAPASSSAVPTQVAAAARGPFSLSSARPAYTFPASFNGTNANVNANAAPSGFATATRPGLAASTGSVAKYHRCGGRGWSGATVCETGSTCKVQNEFYSQCV